MSYDDRVGEYLERGPAASGEADVPDGAVHVRQVLGADSVWADPPPGALDTVLSQIRAERAPADPAPAAPAPVSAPGPPPLRRRSGWRMLVAAAAAVVLLLLGGLAGWFTATWAPSDSSVTATVAGTELAPGASAVARIRDTPGGVAISLDVSGLPPAAPGTYYEGWVKAADGKRASIGTFHMRGGDDTIELWAGVDIARYSTLSVTIQEERAGAQPAGKVVLKGAIPAP